MKHKVLVIDDDLILLDMLKLGLSWDQLQVETASNGAEGVRQFRAQQPDVVIVDLMMPGMSGWEVYRSIRTMSEVPIIFFSALDQEHQVIAGLESGAADYVTKPFSFAELMARIHAVLNRLRRTSQER